MFCYFTFQIFGTMLLACVLLGKYTYICIARKWIDSKWFDRDRYVHVLFACLLICLLTRTHKKERKFLVSMEDNILSFKFEEQTHRFRYTKVSMNAQFKIYVVILVKHWMEIHYLKSFTCSRFLALSCINDFLAVIRHSWLFPCMNTSLFRNVVHVPSWKHTTTKNKIFQYKRKRMKNSLNEPHSIDRQIHSLDWISKRLA